MAVAHYAIRGVMFSRDAHQYSYPIHAFGSPDLSRICVTDLGTTGETPINEDQFVMLFFHVSYVRHLTRRRHFYL